MTDMNCARMVFLTAEQTLLTLRRPSSFLMRMSKQAPAPSIRRARFVGALLEQLVEVEGT